MLMTHAKGSVVKYAAPLCICVPALLGVGAGQVLNNSRFTNIWMHVYGRNAESVGSCMCMPALHSVGAGIVWWRGRPARLAL